MDNNQQRLPVNVFDWLFSLLCMVTILGFFVSRAFVSIGSILLVAAAFYQFGIRATLKRYWAVAFNRIALLLLLVSAASVLWSDNMAAWQQDTVTKLSFLVLPLGFAVGSLSKMKVLKRVIYAVNIFAFITVLHSLIVYLGDVESGHAAYMLHTTRYGDHIRFSFLLSLTVIFNLYLLFEKGRLLGRPEQAMLLFLSVLFFAYLHLLSARTGLLCAYTGIGTLLLVKAWQRKRVWALAVVAAGLLVPVLAVQLSPRLADKVVFMQHEITRVKDQSAAVQYNYSDNNRILSYEAAWDNIKEHCWLGVGTGDLRDRMAATYREKFPAIPEEGILRVPHMQVLSSAMAIGIPAALICILGFIIAPLLLSYRHRLYIRINMLMMLLYFMVDAHLEIQFGILIFLFFTLLWMISDGNEVKDTGLNV